MNHPSTHHTLLGAHALLIALAATPACGSPNPPAPTPDAGCGAGVTPGPGLVATDRGAVRGTAAGATYAFRGVPYAAPPLGDLRFRPPAADGSCWQGERDATQFGARCLQIDTTSGAVSGDEDCLTLNVWAPAAPPAAPLPVMVWIHGGGNVQGSGIEPVYDGQYLAEHGAVVVVTINYRLGPMGFLALPALDAENAHAVSGNYGILDQIAALEWVRRNAVAFGGDPANVTIFGESAGGVDACVLVASPLAGGLFHRAVVQSGSCTVKTLAEVEAEDAQVVTAAGCAGAPDVAACLRALGGAALVQAAPGAAGVLAPGLKYRPNVDGWVLDASPDDALAAGQHNHVPIVFGVNADEMARMVGTAVTTDAEYQAAVYARFGMVLGDMILGAYPSSDFASPQKAWIAVTTDASFVCPARRYARAADAGQSEPVYRYFFTHALENAPIAGQLGAYHALEIPFVFHTFAAAAGYVPTLAELALSDAMVGYWTRFAATGDPDGAGAVAWPPYDSASDPYLQLDDTIVAGAGIRTTKCDLWDSIWDLIMP